MEKIIIRGKIPSKANSYKVITINGHGSLGKTEAVKEYERNFYLQCPIRGAMIDRYFRLNVDVYYVNMRPDLDNCFKVLLDCLQACNAIKNDRFCVEIHGRKLIDKTDPRVEFTLEEVM